MPAQGPRTRFNSEGSWGCCLPGTFLLSPPESQQHVLEAHGALSRLGGEGGHLGRWEQLGTRCTGEQGSRGAGAQQPPHTHSPSPQAPQVQLYLVVVS